MSKNDKRLERSQKAHNRLFEKYLCKSGSHYADVKSTYHHRVWVLQRSAKKVIPLNERRVIYNYLHQSKFDTKPHRKRVTSNEYLGLFRKYGVTHF